MQIISFNKSTIYHFKAPSINGGDVKCNVDVSISQIHNHVRMIFFVEQVCCVSFIIKDETQQTFSKKNHITISK